MGMTLVFTQGGEVMGRGVGVRRSGIGWVKYGVMDLLPVYKYNPPTNTTITATAIKVC